MTAAPLVGMRTIVRAIGAFATRSLLRRRPFPLDKKPASGEGVIAMRREPAFGFGPEVQGRDRRLDARPIFGEGVEEGRDEHVARPAAERIEMNFQQNLRLEAARPSRTSTIAQPRLGAQPDEVARGLGRRGTAVLPS